MSGQVDGSVDRFMCSLILLRNSLSSLVAWLSKALMEAWVVPSWLNVPHLPASTLGVMTSRVWTCALRVDTGNEGTGRGVRAACTQRPPGGWLRQNRRGSQAERIVNSHGPHTDGSKAFCRKPPQLQHDLAEGLQQRRVAGRRRCSGYFCRRGAATDCWCSCALIIGFDLRRTFRNETTFFKRGWNEAWSCFMLAAFLNEEWRVSREKKKNWMLSSFSSFFFLIFFSFNPLLHHHRLRLWSFYFLSLSVTKEPALAYVLFSVYVSNNLLHFSRQTIYRAEWQTFEVTVTHAGKLWYGLMTICTHPFDCTRNISWSVHLWRYV